ncbi:MAG TPA: pantoate--beta-alanine ligase [Stellaceae bacterium]|nr:pantoate--beta-alanine ligase [Stellaceae bacterium]
MTDRPPERIGALAVVRTVTDLRRAIAAWHRTGERVALIPTMGALHRGHLALVEHGRRAARRTVASIFVNPTQFAPSEDFARYPRDEAGDAAKLASAYCDLLYAPDVGEVYPAGFGATVTAGPIAEGQDGRFRPGHFQGVATVVTKLLLQSRADVACFGEKDYQQLLVIRRVARDLDIATRIDGVPTVREPDGLALSSRNVYLTPAERAIAPALHRTLLHVADRIETGATGIAAATAEGLAALEHAGFARIDYLEVCDAETLVPLTTSGRPGRVLAAAWLGKTRLIDNVALRARPGH